MKIYLAARFTKREFLEKEIVPLLAEAGHEITARWVFGGETGLTRTDIAVLDLEDVEIADAVLLFTEPYGSEQKGGGRFVEFGYGLAKGKCAYVIGEYENVFMHHPDVVVFQTIGDFIRAVRNSRLI